MECAPSIAGCILAANTTFSARNWAPGNQANLAHLERVTNLASQVGNVFAPGELDTLATEDAFEMMKFFTERGFTFDISPYGDGNFGLGAVLKLAMKWFVKADPFQIRTNDRNFEGVKLNEEDNPVAFFDTLGHHSPIAEIKVQNGDSIFVTKFGGEVEDKVFGLTKAAQSLSARKKPNYDFESVSVPMLNLDLTTDLDWLIGTRVTAGDRPFVCNDATQQNRLRLNRDGALAESATHMGFECLSISIPKQNLILDEPFLFWVERDGLPEPAFTAFVAEDVWENPGEIEF